MRLTESKMMDGILVKQTSGRKKAEKVNGLVDHSGRIPLLRPSTLSIIDLAAPLFYPQIPIVDIAPRRKVVWVWICCVCGYGGMKVSVDPCPNCCNPRCPNCDTRRINTRSHKDSHFQRGSLSPGNVEAETGPASELDLLPVGKILVGIVTEEGGDEEGETEKHV